MKKERRGGSPLAGLTVAAILRASTAGYVSPLSCMFQAPLMSEDRRAISSAPIRRTPLGPRWRSGQLRSRSDADCAVIGYRLEVLSS